jgi:hypothetical protein
MRVAESIEIGAPCALVWEQVSDPERYLHFMSGVTRWEVVPGSRRTGLGARYRMLLRVGSAEVGGLIEVVEFAVERDLAWTSVMGVDQRGRWRLGWVAEQLAAPTVRGHLKRSLRELARQVEHEQVRGQAAARRRRGRAA